VTGPWYRKEAVVRAKGVAVADNPFATLGLPVGGGLTDEEVRAAWRRIAAATHPDREDGGDPSRYGAAAAAYATLRTPFGRGEALADLGPPRPVPGWRAYRGRRRTRRGGAHRANGGPTRNGGGRWRSWPWAGQGAAGKAGARRAGDYLGYPGSRGGPGTGRALGVRVAGAAAVAAATVAAVGVTPATIGLAAGALTVTGWALWRRGGLGR
jgi:hypothetical protein